MAVLEQEIVAAAKAAGADLVGFTNKERLADAPPSGDLSYVLPNARSAIALAAGLDLESARKYLSKQDLWQFNLGHQQTYRKLKAAGIAVQEVLERNGYDVAVPYANFEYRPDQPSKLDLKPPLSHRYVGAAAGIGWLGWSGNLLTREFGALVSLGSVVTSAELEPSPVTEENWCDDCLLCTSTCPSHFLSKQEGDEVEIAGSTSTYNKKRSHLRCIVSCGAANGMRSKDARWSTWSYKVLDLPGPEDGDEVFDKKVHELGDVRENRLLRSSLGFGDTLVHNWDDYDRLVDNLRLTCSTCQLICWPKMEDRQENYRLLLGSGRIFKGDPRLEKPQPVEVEASGGGAAG